MEIAENSKSSPITVSRADTGVEKASKQIFGRSIKPPIELCARNFPRPMYALMLHLCFYCQKSSAERDCFVTDSGRMYFSVQLCPKCIEFNKTMQDAGLAVLRRHQEERDMMAPES